MCLAPVVFDSTKHLGSHLSTLEDDSLLSTISDINPSAMKQAGYRTLGVANNPNMGPEIGLNRDFDRFHADGSADQLGRVLTEWWEEPGSGPRFAYLHLNDAHSPYLGRSPWYVETGDPQADALSAYDSGIAYLDQYIGRLVAQFAWEDDLVCVVSDHGEEFGDHGNTGHLFSLQRELTQALFVHERFERLLQ